MPNEFEIEDNRIMEYFGNGGAVIIPEGVTDIFFQVFEGNYLITSVSIPGSIPDITVYAFDRCSALSDVTLGEGVESIGFFAFMDCPLLKKVVLPKSLKIINRGAFSGCKALGEICFRGSASEWDMIDKEDGWDADTGDYCITYNYTD